MDNDDEKIKVCFIGYGLSEEAQLALVRVAYQTRDAGFTLLEAVKGLKQILLIEDEPMVRREELRMLLHCRDREDMVELLSIPIQDYGPETHIRPSGSGPVSRIRPSDFRSHIRPLRMLDSRSGKKGRSGINGRISRKRLGK